MSTAHDAHGHGDHVAADGLVHVHVHPTSLYIKVFVALVLLTLLTVGLSRIHLGNWNFFIAVVVATIKAGLVATIFMHLKDDNRFNVLIFIGALVFMGVFFVYTMNDTQHRGQWDESYGTKYYAPTGEVAPGRGEYQTIKLEGGHGHGGESEHAGEVHH
ncbi:MAG: Cytochrome c oxidase polypeptide [Myxococcaceae bacterium]|nr:Cytochrome c oxidase polypeptide [Myxococcaceae bacterium]